MVCRNKVITILGTVLFLLGFSFPTMASNDTIDDVSIDIMMREEEDDMDVNVTTNSDKYHVDKAYIINEDDYDFTDGDQPILKVYLKSEDNFTFSNGFSPKNVKITGSRGTVIGGRLSDTYLKVLIVLNPFKDDASNLNLRVSNLRVEKLEWNEMAGTASWETPGDVSSYEVVLYRGGNRITSTLAALTNTFDFSAYITEEGDYAFKVRGVSHSSQKGKWKKSKSWNVTSEEASKISFGKQIEGSKGPGKGSSTGSWINDNTGWKYSNTNGSKTVSNWQQINGKWYYFNELGYMVTGWIHWKEMWYYCGDDGAMITNTMTPDGYHVGSDGACKKQA